MKPIVILERDIQLTQHEYDANCTAFLSILNDDAIPEFADDLVLRHAYRFKEFILQNYEHEYPVNTKVCISGGKTSVIYNWTIHRSAYHGNECIFSRYHGKLVVMDGAFTFELSVSTGPKGQLVSLVPIASTSHFMEDYQSGVTIGGRRQWQITTETENLLTTLLLAKVNYDG